MIKVGDALPDAQFNVATAEGMKPMRTAEVFGGKTVALFAVPGAFTPTCSARHLPRVWCFIAFYFFYHQDAKTPRFTKNTSCNLGSWCLRGILFKLFLVS
jgi:hypothetical protein